MNTHHIGAREYYSSSATLVNLATKTTGSERDPISVTRGDYAERDVYMYSICSDVFQQCDQQWKKHSEKCLQSQRAYFEGESIFRPTGE